MESTGSTPEKALLVKCPACDWPPTDKSHCPHCGSDLQALRNLLGLPRKLAEVGQRWQNAGSQEEALAHLTAAAVLAPGEVFGSLALARALLAQGSLSQARVRVEEALALEPGNPEALELRLRLETAAASSPGLGKAVPPRVRRWLSYSLGGMMLLLAVLAVGFFIRAPQERVASISPERPLSPVAAMAPTPSEIQARFQDAFPGVAAAGSPGDIHLKGAVATYKELAQLREKLAEFPGLDFSGIKVEHEAYFNYTVKPGDYLTRVAQRFYGDPSRWGGNLRG